MYLGDAKKDESRACSSSMPTEGMRMAKIGEVKGTEAGSAHEERIQ